MTGEYDEAVGDGGARSGAPDATTSDGRHIDSNRETSPPGGHGSTGADHREPGDRVTPPGEAPVCIIGYLTVHDATPRARTDAAATIQRACELSHWQLVEVVTERDSGRRSLDRPGLRYALDRIAAGDAGALVVSELMRLVRSQVDLACLMEWFRERNATLIALDLDIDTSNAAGRRIAEVLIALGRWEQDRIAERTKTGLADAKANGRPVGRPSISDRPELREHIVEMRGAGLTLQAIADCLNADGVATSRGGAHWRPSSVQAALGYRRPSTGDTRAAGPTGTLPRGKLNRPAAVRR
jgi:DNA invertase Pin-like site-specific DNA recombinase